ncbi:MAG: hypothetical protein ACP5GK_09265 [Desulfurella sp.]|uniref:hypothetical protein n=3 Tax=Desulfurella sp. TaxID=1962857 RepID=UPI000CADFC66|nr:hypothetical protein [Desulfurella sp.]PMP91679.1 MAG: hypothetical protein C0173_03075 [Desulfurella sp.]HEX13316.1 hypothetical protein [Desulfurella acetivorans]
MDDIQEKLDVVNKKLDIVLEEVYAQKTHRKSMEDLNADLMKIGESVYDIALENLEEVSEYASIDNVFYFLKKLARNIDNLTKLFNRLESLIDFWESFEPLTREIAISTQDYLDNLEKIGYFSLLKEFKSLMDDLVKNITVEDVNRLSKTLLLTFKALKLADTKKADDLSFLGMVKLLNSKEIKTTLAFFVSFLEHFNKLNQKQ